MHFPDRRPNQSQERILPLVNVVFLLLVFFMITGSLTPIEPFEITPPVSQSHGIAEPDSIIILMGGNNQFALDNTQLSEAQVLEQIKILLQDQPQTQITLKADGYLPANQLVRFTQALYEADVKKLRLLTQSEAL